MVCTACSLQDTTTGFKCTHTSNASQQSQMGPALQIVYRNPTHRPCSLNNRHKAGLSISAQCRIFHSCHHDMRLRWCFHDRLCPSATQNYLTASLHISAHILKTFLFDFLLFLTTDWHATFKNTWLHCNTISQSQRRCIIVKYQQGLQFWCDCGKKIFVLLFSRVHTK